jgi:hypothetical protein
MGMESYGFIPIWVCVVRSSSEWVWGFQEVTFLRFLGSSAPGFYPVCDTYETWVMAACSVNFGARVDKFIRDCLREFYDFHQFSVAPSAGGFAEGFDD